MVKKWILIFTIIFISCQSTKELSTTEKQNVISELNYIYEMDQKYAGLPPQDLIKKLGKEKAWDLFILKRDSAQLENQYRTKKLYSKYGYLGYNEVGKENSSKFWITIQHADNDLNFQKEILKSLKKQIKKGNASKSNYAILEDRIAINSGQKQRFGTQVTYNKLGQAIPRNGLIDSANIEKLRAEYELPTFKEYYNEMTSMHFEMNTELLNRKGITEPLLYK